jgi:hypothetical protein
MGRLPRKNFLRRFSNRIRRERVPFDGYQWLLLDRLAQLELAQLEHAVPYPQRHGFALLTD